MEQLKQDALPVVSGQPWQGVEYFCTTRQGGVSTGPWESFNLGAHAGDDPDAVLRNRERLRALLPGDPVWLKQVHGADVFDADQLALSPQDDSPPVADAAITLQAHRVLAIMTADCLPVVLASTDGQALGIAHAGWRGLAAGVLENTLQALRNRAPGCTQWRAWVGPAISQSCFEVGLDVYQAFVETDPDCRPFFLPGNNPQKWQADLPGLAKQRLHQAGVNTVELSNQCSFNQADMYYSYRRDATTGRMATLAWRTG